MWVPFRVEAKPTFRRDILPYGNRWLDAYDGGRQKVVSGIEVGMKSKSHERGWKAKAEIERLMIDAGDGARGLIRIGWTASKGHVFNVRNDAGNVVFYDAQNGREDASYYFRRAFTGVHVDGRKGLDFLRTDNLPVSSRIGEFVKPKSS